MQGTPWGRLLLVFAWVALALAWILIIPPYENLDELEHAEVVRYIVEQKRLPVHGEAKAQGYRTRQESVQPPLYHLVAAAWLRLWHLPIVPNAPLAVPGTEVACSPTPTLYDKLTWQHHLLDLHRQTREHTLRATRLLSTLMEVATVAAAWALGRRLFRREGAALLTAALVAFNPQFLLVAADVDNDNLVVPLAAWVLVLLHDLWRQRDERGWRWALAGLLAGLAGLSKLSGLGLFALGGAVLVAIALRERFPLRRFIGLGLAFALPALAVITPWVMRNLTLYGDPTALTPMLAEVGHRTQPILPFQDAKLLLLSYWGQMPCTFYPRWVYLPYLMVAIIGSVGLPRAWRRAGGEERWVLGGALLWSGIILLAWLRWDAMTPAPGGRLLFPAATAFALLGAAGLMAVLGRRAVWVGALLALWTWLVTVTVPIAIALPPRLEAASTVPEQAPHFGEALVLVQGEATLHERGRLACWLTTPALAATPFTEEGGCRYLDLHLTWQTAAPLPHGLVFTHQLISPVPGADDVRFAHHGLPAHGTLPPFAWPVGTRIRESLRFPIPLGGWRRQAWDVAVIATDGGVRLPVRVGEIEAGDLWRVARLRLPDLQPHCDDLSPLAPIPRFAEAIALLAAQVETERGRITLCWEARAPLPQAYTVFVHAYAADGTLLATGDGPPMGGAFPTDLWQTGDRIRDRHTLSPAVLDEASRIVVGWYDPQSGARLSAVADVPLPDGGVIIWERGR